jgi:zona occludens toxin
MSIRLHTGLPGHGKTLMTLDKINEWATAEGREVYYSGIKDLKLSWQEIDPKEWKKCPPNSIVVIDEAQFTFGKTTKADEVPHIADLTVHRHGGIDIVLITQHPMLLDPFVRRLIDKHVHVVRRWGSQAATLHEWVAVRTNCELPAGRKDSSKTPYKYPKKVYELYKSAETHTVKRAIPKQFFQLGAIALIVLGLGGYIWNDMHKRATKPDAALAADGTKGAASANSIAGSGAGTISNPQADAELYVFQHTPRVVGLPFTAPRYDEITKPTTAPIPSSCIKLPDDRCWCWSQQGTRLAVEGAVCRQIVSEGFFRDFDDKGGDPRGGNSGGGQQSGNPPGRVEPIHAEPVRAGFRADALPVVRPQSAHRVADVAEPSDVTPETKMTNMLILANASMAGDANERGFKHISFRGH